MPPICLLQPGGSSAIGTTRLTRLAPVTTRYFNPVMRWFTGRLPGFGIVTHRGRVSGRSHQAPVLLVRRGDDYVIGLWYGSQAQWVKNVRTAGRCGLRTGGRDYELIDPVVVGAGSLSLLPLPLRFGARALGLTECLTMRRPVGESVTAA